MSDFGAPTRKWICVGLLLVAIVGLSIAGSAKSWNVGIAGICMFGPAVVTYGPQAVSADNLFRLV